MKKYSLKPIEWVEDDNCYCSIVPRVYCIFKDPHGFTYAGITYPTLVEAKSVAQRECETEITMYLEELW